jgi:ELWxxDGT repeat protein
VERVTGPAGDEHVNGTLFFSAYTDKNGSELWKSDGTAKGTVLVKDIYSGSSKYCFRGYYGGHVCFTVVHSSSPNNLINVNGTLFFVANDGTHGRELWKSDGTSKGTVLVADIDAGSASSYPSRLVNMNGTLFFSGSEPYSPRDPGPTPANRFHPPRPTPERRRT